MRQAERCRDCCQEQAHDFFIDSECRHIRSTAHEKKQDSGGGQVQDEEVARVGNSRSGHPDKQNAPRFHLKGGNADCKGDGSNYLG